MKNPLRTKVVRKIEDISPEDWESVFPDVLESYHFFKSLDESHFEQFSFRYILVYDNETLVGAAPCFLMDYPMDTTVQGAIKKLADFVKKFFPNIFDLKVLICGLPMGQGRIGMMGEPERVIEAILTCMEKIAETEKAAITAFKDFGLSYTDVLDTLQERGFYKFESLPSTEMDISFASFDEYLKTLSRASRDSVKRKFKKLEGRVKIDLEISNELNGAQDDIYKLYLQTVEKAAANGGPQFETLPKEFFETLSRNMPGETKYFFWRINQKLVAFALCLISEGHFIDYYLGFDYSVAYDYQLYFVRFRDLMNWCIENGMKRYEMGPTSYEAKRRLGFDFVRLYGYAKFRNPWINPLFKVLCAVLKPENFDPVFKDMRKKDILVKTTDEKQLVNA